MFEPPEHGRTCFHCNETFTDRWSAMKHFGADESQKPACKIKTSELGLVEVIRELESEVGRAYEALHADGGHAVKAMHGMICRHEKALRNMEELGYERGLADGRNLAVARTD